MCQLIHEVDQIIPEVDQLIPVVDQLMPEVDQLRQEVDQLLPDVMRLRTAWLLLGVLSASPALLLVLRPWTVYGGPLLVVDEALRPPAGNVTARDDDWRGRDNHTGGMPFSRTVTNYMIDSRSLVSVEQQGGIINNPLVNDSRETENAFFNNNSPKRPEICNEISMLPKVSETFRFWLQQMPPLLPQYKSPCWLEAVPADHNYTHTYYGSCLKRKSTQGLKGNIGRTYSAMTDILDDRKQTGNSLNRTRR